ncbi:ABC transporter ATP-binding protein [Piscinibacter sp. HJYY11]|uniref:ABC transporter ATP-binding protein n=1 Tax=Piscinibacter sp. HJYY11 TaxID=2801333 RepID=UPI00191EDBC0|nr:ABC transporter ATP-binding protein [Piscinibacter sp. HJYY11]MBL0729646.1 ABC transporter ATP-binding protein [Piscinibacter sp. HJYY11]
MATDSLLKVSNLKVAYGGIEAVKTVSFDVHAGELVCLIGSNGAGKSTTLKALTGLQPALQGDIEFLGQSTRGQASWDLARKGLVMVPEGRGTFTRMTVSENLMMGAFTRDDVAGIKADIEKVYGLFPKLAARRDQLAGTMSGGEQQMLAMGRALMAQPRLLLLDEPSMGLSPVMVDMIFHLIERVHRDGVTVLLVEQNAGRALEMADRGYVMESGEITLQGSAKTLASDERVRAAYLGC